MLSTVKVPSDPAQIVVNHASFRVQLATPPPRSRALSGVGGLSAARGTTPVRRPAGRRAPVVWSGRTEPGDARTTRLLQAARYADGGEEPGNAATQVLPRLVERVTPSPDGGPPTAVITTVGEDGPPTVIGPRGPQPPERPLLEGVRPAEGAYDTYEIPGQQTYRQPYEPHEPYEEGGTEDGYGERHDGEYEGYGEYEEHEEGEEAADGARDETRSHREPPRHGYYPGRRMNLGVVLLPLRIFLGLISVGAGMGKLCDPVYFDGGERGSLVVWLHSLKPWAVAEPLRDFAVAHPVGAGLSVAFLQIIVGVLTVLGLWQRLAASLGALLSAALLVTVSWRTVPVYEAPDIIYLAAWSPLAIAGAPYYSLDARLAGEAWRRLGPRVGPWELRQRVLRRGTVIATVVLGLTLLVGSVMGSAVRSAQVANVPEPGAPLINNLPGSPLPSSSGEHPSPFTSGPGAGVPSAGTSAVPGPSAPGTGAVSTPAAGGTGGSATVEPNRQQTVPVPPRQPDRPAVPVPEPPTAVGASGGSGGSGDTGGADGGGGEEDGDGHSSGGSGGGERTGALGGLLG
ncbi:MAG TPA: DoxX family membrane protein [Streptomyces sp.]|nr:DoxX family membrane protein [Streptomyces sp.]